ncbi:hypothetical protein RhiJN_26495 [Ceratobasidium sp. AG-Ba]|nr:hypothetical protein RhiJN_26495 [Ceratobasidium sp. AG-Ba]
MRLLLSLVLGCAVLICTTLAKDVIIFTASSSLSPNPEPTSAPDTSFAPDPAPTDLSTTFYPTSDTQSTFPTSVGTAAPPNGGGATCVQDCLAIAASGAGCSSSVDIRCVCSSFTFLGLAQNCFGMSSCDSGSASRALNDQRVVCGAGATTSTGQPTQAPSTASALTPVRTDSGTLSGFNTVTTSRQASSSTVLLSSGAVLTVSGVRTTLTAGLTVVSQPLESAKTGGAESSNSNGGLSVHMAIQRWDLAGWVVGFGIVGGPAVL